MLVGDLWLPTDLFPPTVPDDVELCGVLVGKRRWLIKELVLLDNTHEDPTNHYEMFVPPTHAKRVVALFHTHPEGTVWPSEHDREQSQKLGLPGVIVTPKRKCCVYNGFHIIASFTY